MTQSISPDLFMAILSMDSYNRGYNAGIGGIDGLGSTAVKVLYLLQ
jgi:hypothetical protein